MGLLNFIKDVGVNLFGGGKDEAEEIKKLLTDELGSKLSNLTVTVKDGTVTLAGSCDSNATKEKAALLAGNVKGIEKVISDNLVAPEPEAKTEFYTIQKGDSLWKIAKKYYGDGNKYPKLFEANREVIKDPDKIYPGQQIRIPKLDD